MTFHIIFLVCVCGGLAIHLITEFLNLRALKQPLTSSVKQAYGDSLTEESHARTRDYIRSHSYSEVIETLIITGALLGFYGMHGFGWINDLSLKLVYSLSFFDENLAARSAVQGLISIAILGVMSGLLGIPFRLYDTFVIEEKFGFNRTTFKTFVLDLVKGIVLAIIFGGPLLLAVLYLFERFENAWFYALCVVMFFQMFMLFIFPAFIAPIFNRFEPLPEGELKSEIQTFATKQNFKLNGIFKMDGSKRSTKANAYFTGFGKYRRIVLFDSLMQKLSQTELVAVLAHEIGHYKLKHIPRQLLLAVLTTGAFFGAFAIFLNYRNTLAAFDITTPTVAISFIAFSFVYAPLGEVFGLIRLWMSRTYEFEADAYAIKTYGSPYELGSALKKLGVENLSNPQPHPLKVFLEYTHPPLDQRLDAINRF